MKSPRCYVRPMASPLLRPPRLVAGMLLLVLAAGCARHGAAAPDAAWRHVTIALCEDYPLETATRPPARRTRCCE